MTSKSRARYVPDEDDFYDDESYGSSYSESPYGSYGSPSPFQHRANNNDLSQFLPSLSKQEPPKKQADKEFESNVSFLKGILGNKFKDDDLLLALQKNDNDVNGAAEWLLQNKEENQFQFEMEEADSKPNERRAEPPKSAPVLEIGKPKKTELKQVKSGIEKMDISDKKEEITKPKPEKEEAKEKKDTSKSVRNVKQMTSSKRKEIENKIQAQINEKVHLNLVIIGHVDAGKSTIMGHLLVLLGYVPKKTIHKYEKDSKAIGKGSFSLAWVLDQHEEERNRGVTMDVGVTNFETDNRQITLLDAPGHRDFVPNMISGAAQADVGLLVINASPGEFETGFESDGQTKEHALLARSLGINSLAVVINKLDTVEWSQERYEFVISKLQPFLSQTGFERVSFIPCSGLTGENILERKEPNLSWYKGPTLVQQIDSFPAPVRETEKPFRLCISDVYKADNFGIAVGGKIESGFVSSNNKLLMMPLNEVCTVKGIRIHENSVDFAKAGDNVDIAIAGIEISNIKIGNILCDPENPIGMTNCFEAQIIVFNPERPLIPGHPVKVHYQSLEEPGNISSFICIINKQSGTRKKKPRVLQRGQSAVVKIKTERPICLEKYSDFRQLGRFTLREGTKTIASGIVTQLQ